MRLVRILSVGFLVFLAACGGNPPSNKTPVSKVMDRVFLSNSQSNLVQIIDAQADKLSTFTISITAPSALFESADKSTTMAYSTLAHAVTAITNSTETIVGSGVSLPDFTDSLAISPNGQTAYAAFPTLICSGAAVVGAVGVVDLVNSNVKTCIAIAAARSIALSHNGNTLLVFSDNSNTVNAINTGALTTAPVQLGTPSFVFDHPVSAVFSSDDSTAYILSCGLECGGGTASVTRVTAVGSSAPAPGATLPLSAAREGLLNGSTLYIAGTNPVTGGVLQVVDAALTTAQSVGISDGAHDTMAFQGSSVFIGARACTNQAHGCVSIFDTGSKQVFFDAPSATDNGRASDDVTGMEAIPGRSVVYVCEGGELRIYDASTHALAPTQIDIVGDAVDVREVF